MPDGSIPNAVDNGSYHSIRFLPGLPGGLPSVRFDSIDDGTGMWYDPDTKSIKMRFAGTDVYQFDDTGGINVLATGGPILLQNGSASAPSLSFLSESDVGFYWLASKQIGIAASGFAFVRFARDAGIILKSTCAYSWGSGDASSGADTNIFREAAGIIGQRNGTNAQIFRIYSTYTDASNYERLAFTYNGSDPWIKPESAGTGTNRTLYLGGAVNVGLVASGSTRWMVTGTQLYPVADLLYDVGISTNFVKDIYVRRRIGKIAVVTYSASMTPDAALGDFQQITVTNGSAFTINGPSNPLTGQRLTIQIRNASGGAAGAATWNAAFKMTAWTQPANGFSRTIEFNCDGANWVEVDRTAADVPN